MITASYGGDKSNKPSTSRSLVQTVQAPPAANISSPADHGTFRVGQRVHTRFSCSDGKGGSGLSSCNDSTGTHTHSGGSGHLDTGTPGRHTYTVVAKSRDGLEATTMLAYTVEQPVPRLSKLTVSPQLFVAASKGPAVIARFDAGTTISYVDTLAGHTTFRVLSCAHQAGPCRHPRSIGTFSHQDRTGLNRVRFTGRLNGHKLAPGRYVLEASSTLHGRRSPTVTTTFTILSPPPTCIDRDNDGDCDSPPPGGFVGRVKS
jgi:hypothetical protein